MPRARVAGLFVYPVKSLRGIAVDAATIAETGLCAGGVTDREWMVVDGDGRFVTQRELPRLALITPLVADARLMLTAAGAEPLDVPLDTPSQPSRPVVVWQSAVRGHDEGDAAADWLATRLGRPLRLVRFDRSERRLCNPAFAGDSGAHTLFADGYPLLVIGTASLADLNARLAAHGSVPLPMNRFRPSLVLGGLAAYDEDHLDTLDAGGTRLRMVKPCIRCTITATDQATAAVGLEPLPTLAGYRHDAELGGVRFGMNAIVAAAPGAWLRVSDTVEAAWRF
jgi:uncharacterized protein YcbX